MLDQHPTLSNLPSGWTILKSKPSKNPRDPVGMLWVILCENTDGQHTRYVIWKANTQDGGCFLGHYHNSLIDAERDYSIREF